MRKQVVRDARTMTLILGLALASLLAACGPSVNERGGARSASSIASHSEREVELPADAIWVAVAVGGDLVYVLGQPLDASMLGAPDRYLIAIDRRSGEERWRSDFMLPNSGVSIYASELTPAGDVLLFRSESMIVALARSDGRVLWHIEDPSAQLRFVDATGDTLYTATYPSQITAWSLRDGTEQRRWDLHGYIFSGYGAAGEAWLTTDGRQLVAVVDPSSGGGEVAVVTLDLQTSTASPREVLRYPVRYDVQETLISPMVFPNAAIPTYSRSDYVAKVTTSYERIEYEMWSVLDGEQVWKGELSISQDYYYGAYGYYGPRMLLTRNHSLLQEPGSEGVLLRNVLRLHLHDVGSFGREWTNVLPTQHYVTAMFEVGQERIVVQTRHDSGTFSERWYAFDARTGSMVWASDDTGYIGSTRAVASDGTVVARLMTSNWTDGRLFLDEF